MSKELEQQELNSSVAEIKLVKEWNPADPLRVDNLDPEKAHRWVDKKKLEQRKHEGWKPVAADKVNYPNPDTEESGGAAQYRDLVLCEMPREQAEERKEYYRRKTQAATMAARQNFEKKVRESGADFIEDRKPKKFYSFGR